MSDAQKSVLRTLCRDGARAFVRSLDRTVNALERQGKIEMIGCTDLAAPIWRVTEKGRVFWEEYNRKQEAKKSS